VLNEDSQLSIFQSTEDYDLSPYTAESCRELFPYRCDKDEKEALIEFEQV